YLVSDGTAESAVATVTINVEPANDAPIVGDDAYTVAEDETLVVGGGQGLVTLPGGLLDNDSDPDGDPLTVSLVTGPQHGSLTLNEDGTFSYTPHENFFGTDTFTYVASDGTATSGEATVTIEVTAVNDAPIVGDDEYAIGEDEVLTIDAGSGV